MYVQAGWLMRRCCSLKSSCQASRHRTDCIICPIKLDDWQQVMKQVKLCRWMTRLKHRPEGTKCVYLSASVPLLSLSLIFFFATGVLSPLLAISHQYDSKLSAGPAGPPTHPPSPIDKDHCPTLPANRSAPAGRRGADAYGGRGLPLQRARGPGGKFKYIE